jgi:hypothetical protein
VPLPRFAFVHLAPLPPELVLLHGEPAEWAPALAPASRWQPAQAVLRLPGGARLVAPRAATGAYHFALPPLTAAGPAQLRVGDTTARLPVRLVFRPELTALTASVTPPDYLGLPPRQQPVDGARLSLPADSRVQLVGVASRPLAAVTALVGELTPITLDEATFTTAPVAAAAEAELALTWRDRDGFAPRQPLRLTLQPQPDQPPTVDCPETPRRYAIAATETLAIPIVARDDYGVRQVALRQRLAPAAPATETPLATGAPAQTALTTTYLLAPAAQGITPGSIVTLTALATDYQPDAVPVPGPELQIHILTMAEHARVLREQFDRLLATTEEITRAEEAALLATTELAARSEEALAQPAGQQQLQEQAHLAAAHAEALDQLAEDLAELLREALRNGEFESATLAQWSKLAPPLQELGQQALPQLARQFQQARQGPGQRQEATAQAARQQEQIVARLKALQEQAGDRLDELTVQSFVQRLRNLAAGEQRLREPLAQHLPALVGLTPEQLPPALGALLRRLGEEQRRLRADALALHADLRGFVNRTSLPPHRTVLQELTAAKLESSLESVVALIEQCRPGQALEQVAQWAARFQAWADLLSPPTPADGGSGGDSGSQPPDPELVMELLRLLQEQTTLRTTTRALDAERAAAAYAARAAALSDRQFEAYHRLARFDRQLDDLRLTPLFTQAGTAMVDAATFLRVPRTDEEPLGAQTEAIELLGALVQQAAQQQSQQQPALSAFLLQMLGRLRQEAGPGEGDTGRGYQGRATGAPAAAPPGAIGAQPGEVRPGELRSGPWRDRIPFEFRPALEGYYRALEQLPPE